MVHTIDTKILTHYKPYKFDVESKGWINFVDSDYCQARRFSNILDITYNRYPDCEKICILFQDIYFSIQGRNLQILFKELVQEKITHIYIYPIDKDLPNLDEIKQPVIFDCFSVLRDGTLSKEEEEIIESLEKSENPEG